MADKLITFAVPCYNSAEYMDHCVRSLLAGGEDVEIILVDDGSTKDDTPAICDRYASEYPDIVRVIHQENGGHGEGVNQGIRNATGTYFKVVDSDDWLDETALKEVLDKLREFVSKGHPLDMMVANYVYEHVSEGKQKVVDYKRVLPVRKVFTWKDIGHFAVGQYIIMHSVIYRTQLLRDCGLELPKHTFYVDNIFVYQPLPFVKTLYYMDVDLYRYYIGRADQSVQEDVMISRVDQQVRVTKIIIDAHDISAVEKKIPKLGKYLFRYLSIMMVISSVFLMLDGSPERMIQKDELWDYLKAKDKKLYRKIKHFSLAFCGNMPKWFTIPGYHLAQKLYKFN